MKPDAVDVKPDAALFRRESTRLLATLTRAFGVQNMALAEDVVQETLASAFATWSYEGVPAHYSALLTTAAKNRAIDVFRRNRTARAFAPQVQRELESEWTLRPVVEELFLPEALRDDELRMMFTCSSPQLDDDVQVALVLNILCGFGVGEIASAFLATPAAIEKRLSRGKRALAKSKRLFELRAEDVTARLSTVHRALYLLFNEGYHGACPEAVVRAELCGEAMRLVRLLVRYEPAATPETLALAALMCLHAARLPARVDEAGELRALFQQDRSRWDANLLKEGLQLLDASASGDALSAFHVEAGIAAVHAEATSTEETRWGDIVALYDVLMATRPSPVVALSRAIAVAERDGPAAGLAAIGTIESVDRLARYPFYPAALGELERRRGHRDEALAHFRRAFELARNEGERRFLKRRIAEYEDSPERALGTRGTQHDTLDRTPTMPATPRDVLERAIHELCRRADEGGLESLPPHPRTVVVAWATRGVIGSGGFRYFYEGSWHMQAAAAAFRALGFLAAAEACERSLEIFPDRVPPRDARRRSEILSRTDFGPYTECESVVYAVGFAALKAAIGAYMDQHSDHFAAVLP